MKLLGTILRLKDLKVTGFTLKPRKQELHLAVKPYKNGCRCPHCGRRGRIVHRLATARVWEDLTLLGMKVFHAL